MFEIQPKKQIIRVTQTQAIFIFEINVGKSRIRQDKTNFKLNDEFLDRVKNDDVIQFQFRCMSDPTFYEFDFKIKWFGS